MGVGVRKGRQDPWRGSRCPRQAGSGVRFAATHRSASHHSLIEFPSSSKYKPENATVFSATPEVLQDAFRRGEGRLQRASFDTKTSQEHYVHFAAAQPAA